MKRQSLFFAAIVILLLVVAFTTISIPALEEPDPEGMGGGGGGTLWRRKDERCPDRIREKTTCTRGGLQDCTSQYCN